MEASCAVSSSDVSAVRLRTIPPVARSSRAARSAKASAPHRGQHLVRGPHVAAIRRMPVAHQVPADPTLLRAGRNQPSMTSRGTGRLLIQPQPPEPGWPRGTGAAAWSRISRRESWSPFGSPIRAAWAGSCRTLAGGEHDLGDPFGAALGDQDLRAGDDLISCHHRITTKNIGHGHGDGTSTRNWEALVLGHSLAWAVLTVRNSGRRHVRKTPAAHPSAMRPAPRAARRPARMPPGPPRPAPGRQAPPCRRSARRSGRRWSARR
jgi:hypothetical protein